MATPHRPPLQRVFRTFTLGALGMVRRDLSDAEIEERFDTLTRRQQTLIGAMALAALTTTSLVFAAFGIFGLVAFLLVIVFLVR
ncbi:MAG: hypothetical protein AAFY59_14835 [Pseudomonadota bacterium]